jgi:cellulose synthase/poly-beta-1,6-N-acetylglucosamine synthase-like glycosyltransferase
MVDFATIYLILCCCLPLWIILPARYIAAFARLLKTNSLPEAQPLAFPSSALPKATIILCLRGSDPFLADCLTSLLAQDYPNYRLHIVVDSLEDPAMAVVNQRLRQSPHKTCGCCVSKSTVPITISPLRIKYSTCSLKCSALLQAVSELEPDCEVIALADADTIAHPTWLQDLVQPLTNPEIGVTTGNRWYMPKDSQWGSLFRYLWNASAIIYMVNHEIPWGGSLAIKTQVLRDCGVLEQWREAFVEDVPLRSAIQAKGLRVHLVPSTIMINQESCTIGSFTRWRQRQELATWLYYPPYNQLIAYCIVLIGLLLLAYGGLGWSLIAQQWDKAVWFAVPLSLNFVITWLLQQWVEQELEQILQARQIQGSPFSWLASLKLAGALMAGQLWGNLVLVFSAHLKQVEWRGITYRITGRKVQLVEYQPYRPLERVMSSSSL